MKISTRDLHVISLQDLCKNLSLYGRSSIDLKNLSLYGRSSIDLKSRSSKALSYYGFHSIYKNILQYLPKENKKTHI
jgi:hypothetical protein